MISLWYHCRRRSMSKAISSLVIVYIASVGDGTADMDGWLKMTVQIRMVSCSMLRNQGIYISKGAVLALPSSGWSLRRLFLNGSAGLVPCLLYLGLRCQCFVQSPTSPGERERNYKVDARTSALSRVRYSSFYPSSRVAVYMYVI